MREFVESLKRLYASNMVAKEKVIALYAAKRITQEEKDYVLETV